ncbi:3-carboxy-cis,cis-muconate cycloisomerase [Roseibium hamelinense]|uniref:3-carboxy-cis,cis-muconate cycloisomerase n=1 Tax=Roseibium hamelinense TaxID=150831 RepID=A0A562TA34_9HYPH|nr:adenylosuccinate lyase family protein [Roseibium hamelinense]MTI43507.1 adenylosuccinate lyase family protein [Roseibium hamelinense]TWI89700.1 3-carboxy-cis,cis-muconate cycloisomerase [Roseibium hamelinense]
MAFTAFDSAITGALLSDAETAAQFDDARVVRAFLRVEAALARAQAAIGAIPAQAGTRITQISADFELPPETLREGTAQDGIPIPTFVAALRSAVGPDVASYVHLGATSQDIMDTGLVLRLRDVFDLHERRLIALGHRLVTVSRAHATTPMAARTRMQQASPTSFGLKTAGWLAALTRHLQRLAELRKRTLVLSLSGAAGNMAAFGPDAATIERTVAQDLNLAVSPAPWHSLRDNLGETAGWFALVTGTLGKIGEDLVLLAQNEVAEIRLAAGGGSSTMPNKANPVLAETLVALARHNAAALGGFHQSVLQSHERGGAGWTLEWMVLPQMAVAAGAALQHFDTLLNQMQVDEARMLGTIHASKGLLLAEAVSFALSEHMPRADAITLTKKACGIAAEENTDLFEVLPRILNPALSRKIAWQDLRNPARHLGQSNALINRIVESFQAVACKTC